MTTAHRLSAGPLHTVTHVDGASLLAASLHRHNVTAAFGVVGIPVVELGTALADRLTFLSCRNEQTASYAASYSGYLTGWPAVCLSVSGPGLLHSLAGVGNSWANGWPLLIIVSWPDALQRGRGAFQEAPQREVSRPLIKYAAVIEDLTTLPSLIERCIRESMTGRPGPVLIEVAGERLRAVVERSRIQWNDVDVSQQRIHHLALRSAVDVHVMTSIARAVQLLSSAYRPLLIVGKGAAFARAETEIRALHDLLQIPFLPTPMGKGVIPDSHPLNAAAARSLALSKADVILVLGARFNWMLHFGAADRFDPQVKIIQVDICAEELGKCDIPLTVSICADINVVAVQMKHHIMGEQQQHMWRKNDIQSWKQKLADVTQNNFISVQKLMSNRNDPITYYRAFGAILSLLSHDAIIVNEGANTMDIGRILLTHNQPRSRLDAATFATMGMGVGAALAAAQACPTRKVVAIEGDSAFGFSAMDFETAVRYGFPITFIVLNNNGVYQGSSEEELQLSKQNRKHTPVTSLSHGIRYDLIASALAGSDVAQGFLIDKSHDLESVLRDALSYQGPCIVNIVIASQQQGRHQATHSWMSSTKTAAKM